jgi:hypothetical protein
LNFFSRHKISTSISQFARAKLELIGDEHRIFVAIQKATSVQSRSSYALRDYGVTGESEGEEWREGLPQKGARSREKKNRRNCRIAE